MCERLDNSRCRSWTALQALMQHKRGVCVCACVRACLHACVCVALLKKHDRRAECDSRSSSLVEPGRRGGWGPKWARVKVFLDHTGNLQHRHQQQHQQHRGLVPGFPNPLPLLEEGQCSFSRRTTLPLLSFF